MKQLKIWHELPFNGQPYIDRIIERCNIKVEGKKPESVSLKAMFEGVGLGYEMMSNNHKH